MPRKQTNRLLNYWLKSRQMSGNVFVDGKWSAFKQEEKHNRKSIIIMKLVLQTVVASIQTPFNPICVWITLHMGRFNDRSTI